MNLLWVPSVAWWHFIFRGAIVYAAVLLLLTVYWIGRKWVGLV